MAVDDTPAAELLDSFSTLLRTARALAQRLKRQLGPSSTSVALLKSLCEGDARLGDLAVRLCIAPSVVSRVVVPLEAEGLVERRHDPDDARAYLLALTPDGRAVLADIRHQQSAMFAELIADWPEDDVRAAIRVCERLDAALSPPTTSTQLPHPRVIVDQRLELSTASERLEKITV